MIRLFPADAAEFSTNGLGGLSAAISCLITQELNGGYELKMTYPVTGIRYADISLRSIIVAPVDPVSDPQPFRVYRITKPLNGIITIYARHLAYDLQGIVDAPFSANDLHDALLNLPAFAATGCPFTFDTDKTVASPFTVTKPAAIWNLLSGQEGSLLDVYGGEFEFNAWEIYLHSRRGSDRGVTIAYGKNLTSYQQEQNNAAVYTGVYPYWANEDGTVTLPEQILVAEGTYDFTRILALDLSDEFTEPPTEEQLRARATTYMSANQIGVPKVSWKIGFAQLEQNVSQIGAEFVIDANGILSGDFGLDANNLLTGDFQLKGNILAPKSEMAASILVLLGDTVHVRFPRYQVTASARVVSVVWNALLNRYDSITLGSVKANLAQTIATQAKEIEEKPSTSQVTVIAEMLAEGLLGANGGIVRLLDTNGDGAPDELYIADNADPALAVKVWRFNYNGWAASSSGYAGPYSMGATLEAGLLADFVTAARLAAGTIQSADGSTFYLDLDNGILRMDATEVSIGGQDMSLVISGYTDPLQIDLDDLKAHIVVAQDGSMTFIGAEGNPITLRLVNDQLGIYNGGTLIDSFAADGTTTQNLTIPTGGSFSMGNFKFAPRSNGSLDLLWVG